MVSGLVSASQAHCVSSEEEEECKLWPANKSDRDSYASAGVGQWVDLQRSAYVVEHMGSTRCHLSKFKSVTWSSQRSIA
jgi:hypothetical protein